MERETIKSVYDSMCSTLHIDHSLFHKVCDMEVRFVSKKQEHIEFFGGNLTGVQVVRFTDSDKNKIFDDILNIDESILQERLYALRNEKHELVIRQDWVISSDLFNISCFWLMHAFHNTTQLGREEKHEAKVRVCCYLFYKLLTSLLFNFFKFPADPDVAKATYANLSYKYALKQFGSWGATIRNLAENTVAENSIHFNTIANMDDDLKVIYALNDIQGRIRDMLKNIYSEFIKTHVKGTRISSSSSFVENDGELVLKDNTKSPGIYNRYLKGIISDKNTFIKQELIDVISGTMHTLSPRLLLQTLNWVSDHYQNNKDTDIDKAVDIVLEHAIEYTSANSSIMRKKDISVLIDYLRGAYMSSRSTDPTLLMARKLVEKIVRDATGSHNESGIASVRTAFMLYLVTRAYTMRFYTNR